MCMYVGPSILMVVLIQGEGRVSFSVSLPNGYVYVFWSDPDGCVDTYRVKGGVSAIPCSAQLIGSCCCKTV